MNFFAFISKFKQILGDKPIPQLINHFSACYYDLKDYRKKRTLKLYFQILYNISSNINNNKKSSQNKIKT